MAQPRFEVLHLDDQPELQAWIARSISTWFWKNFTDDMARIDGEDEDIESDIEIVLRLQVGNERLDTRYRIFTTPEEMLASTRSIEQGVVALVLLDQVIGKNLLGGTTTYKKLLAVAPLLEAKTFMLSAMPGPIYKDLGWPIGFPKVIIKPQPPDRVIGIFVRSLTDMTTISPHTKERLAKALVLLDAKAKL